MYDAAPLFIDPAYLHQHGIYLQTVIEEVARIAHARAHPSMQGITTLEVISRQLICIEICDFLQTLKTLVLLFHSRQEYPLIQASRSG